MPLQSLNPRPILYDLQVQRYHTNRDWEAKILILYRVYIVDKCLALSMLDNIMTFKIAQIWNKLKFSIPCGGGRKRIGRREKWSKKSWEEGEIRGKSTEEGENMR